MRMKMIEAILETGQVRRYHANPVMARALQTTADHSWGVAALILALHPNPSLNLIKAAIFHDSGERFAGDLPAPFKRRYPALAEEHSFIEYKLASEAGVPDWSLTDEEHQWLKLMDRVESFIYMRLHGETWSADAKHSLLEMSAELKINNQIRKIIDGN